VSGIGRQEQRLGIHQLGEDKDFVVLDPGAQKALVEGADADPLKGVHKRLVGVREVQVVIDLSIVCLLGIPSLKSSVPMRVSTLSGVAMDGGTPAVA
jgi:hypothetical protein